MGITSDYNIQKKVTKKMKKYGNLQKECWRMWDKKVDVRPVILDATGVFNKNIQSYLHKLPGKNNIYNLQR